MKLELKKKDEDGATFYRYREDDCLIWFSQYDNGNIYRVNIQGNDGIEYFAVEVKPETVGQFTGLCDKNGNKIFEGDIVESPHGTQGFIEWQNAECAFLVNIGDDLQTMDDCPYEVIGNIYDNKEEEE